jgi:hypothetical protein
MKPIVAKQIKVILKHNPKQKFSLFAIKFQVIDSINQYFTVGYHVYKGHKKGMKRIIGQDIWNYIDYWDCVRTIK